MLFSLRNAFFFTLFLNPPPPPPPFSAYHTPEISSQPHPEEEPCIYQCIFNNHFLLSSSTRKSFSLPSAAFWTCRKPWSRVSSPPFPPRYMPLFFSRIGVNSAFPSPAFKLLMLVDFHRVCCNPRSRAFLVSVRDREGGGSGTHGLTMAAIFPYIRQITL